MSIPLHSKLIRPGIYRDPDGRLHIRGEAVGPDGRSRCVGPRLADSQETGRRGAAAAELELATRQELIREGRYEAASRPRWTVRAYAVHIRGRRTLRASTGRTWAAQAEHWLKHLGDMLLVSVEADDIVDAWRHVLEAGLAPSTLRLILTSLRAPFRSAFREGLIMRDPAAIADLRAPLYEPETVARLRGPELLDAFAYWKDTTPMWGTFFALQWSLGLRPGECLAMRWAWLDDESVTIPASVAKQNRTRRIPLSPWHIKLLAGQRLRHCHPTDDAAPVWPSLLRPAQPFSDKTVRVRFKAGVVAAGLTPGRKGYTPHTLRKSFKALCDLLKVRNAVSAAILGHAEANMSDRYDGPFAGEMRDAVEAIATHVSDIFEPATASTTTATVAHDH